MFINKRNCLVAENFASDDPARTALQTVRLTKDYMEVISGRLLARVTYPEFSDDDFPVVKGLPRPTSLDKGQEVLVDAGTLAGLRKEIPKPKQVIQPILENLALDVQSEDVVTAMTTDLSTGKSTVLRKIEDDYPKTDSVFPGGENCAALKEPLLTVHLSMGLLEKVIKTCKGMNHVEEIKLSFHKTAGGTTEGLPITFEVKDPGNDQKVWGIIMPLREQND